MQDIRNVTLPSYKQTSGLESFCVSPPAVSKIKTTPGSYRTFTSKFPNSKTIFLSQVTAQLHTQFEHSNFKLLFSFYHPPLGSEFPFCRLSADPLSWKSPTFRHLGKTFSSSFFSRLSRPGKRHPSFPKALKTHHLSHPVDVTAREQQEWKWQCYKDNKFPNERPPS